MIAVKSCVGDWTCAVSDSIFYMLLSAFTPYVPITCVPYLDIIQRRTLFLCFCILFKLLNQSFSSVLNLAYFHSSSAFMSSLDPPPGGDQNQGPKIIIVQWVLTALALIVVGGRIFGRFRITHNAGLDDLWIIIAMVTSPYR